MPFRWVYTAAALSLACAAIRATGAEVVPPGDTKPLLRLEAGGPTAFVTSLAFSPSGETLYAAGWDKVVRSWTHNAQTGRFELDRSAQRVPIGPGLDGGAINAIALSADGTWLAVAGKMVFRQGAGFRDPGWVVPSLGGMSKEMQEDQGTIYIFDTRDRTARVRLLRGHRGPVFSLAFAPVEQEDRPPQLVAAAEEWDAKAKHYKGVVRLWDVSKGTSVARDLPIPTMRPGLAVWHSGDQKRLQVAIAWGDGFLRVWDVASGKVFAVEDGREYNDNTTAYLPGADAMLSGSFRERAGHLQLWTVAAGRKPHADDQRAKSLPAENQTFYSPRALTLLSTSANGKLDHAALIVRAKSEDKDDYRLYLLDLHPQRFGRVVAKVSLWAIDSNQVGNQPVVAAAPHGRYLAVAGQKDNGIRIYSIRDLLDHSDNPAQELRSVGEAVRQVRFVTKGQDQGLLLNLDADDSGRKLIFDFAKRNLTTDQNGWKIASARHDDWRVVVTPAQRDSEGRIVSGPIVQVQGGKPPRSTRRHAPIKLQRNQEVTAWALLAPKPRSSFAVPILALAIHDSGQPLLRLYNGVTAEPVRQFTGHDDLIHSLAFSADGRLLASAADDQTVCVWSLTDLDRVLGKRGLLKGLAVVEKGGKLVVAQIDDLPARSASEGKSEGKLEVDDVIDGLMEGDKPRPLTTPFAFYDALSHVKPGTTVSLRVEGKGIVARLVGQGVDERKPLLSLFVTRGDMHEQRSLPARSASEGRDWLGWSPIGFYESSEREVERYLGWHFNTGKADHPTTFALAGQYRKEYYREGILKRLIDEGALPTQDAPKKPLPPPSMTLWIDEAGLDPKKVDGMVLLQQPRATLKLAINNFPREQVASVQWQVDGAAAKELTSSSGGQWSADLPPLQRGEHVIRVVLAGRDEANAKTYEESLPLLYLPPPPKITSDQLGKRLAIEKPTFAFHAALRSGLPENAVKVLVLHKFKGSLMEEKDFSGQENMKLDLQLKPGENLIEVSAVNRDALPKYRELETNRQFLVVAYREKEPPRITLTAVRTAPDETGRTLKIEPGKPVIVDVAKIRVEGTIEVKASQKLIKPQWRQGKRAARPFANFDPNHDRKFDEELDLEPGPQEFRVMAGTDPGGDAETAVTIEYRPKLPELNLMPPKPGVILYEGQDPQAIQLEGWLDPPPDPREYTATLWNNGHKLPDRPKIDPAAQKLSAKVPLQVGDNRIQVELSNPWHVTSTSEVILVRYLRPPRGIHFGFAQPGMRCLTDMVFFWPKWAVPGEMPQMASKPLAELVAQARSTLPLDSVDAEINGRKVATLEIIRPTQPHDATYTIRLKDVPLDVGRNLVRVWASNAEGRSREPGTLRVVYNPPKPPQAPGVEILDPRQDITLDRARYKVQFRVRSTSTIKRIALLRGEQVLFSQDLTGLERGDKGFFEVASAPVVKLIHGANTLQVVSVNEDGERRAAVTLSFVYKPVQVLIDKLELQGQPGQFILAQRGENNVIAFKEAPAGKLWLHGRVLWLDEDDERLKDATKVLLWVNGLKQVPSELQGRAGKGLERAFRAEVQLTQVKGNKIEVELPDLKQEAGNRSSFLVDCRQPEHKRQRVHLLIVGIGEKDSKKLTDRVLKALRASDPVDGSFQAPAFEGHLYGPLVGGYVGAHQVYFQLQRIKEAIKQRLFQKEDGEASLDVVLVYFQGGESAWSAISYDGLSSCFGEVPGAQLLLLDVACEASPSSRSQAGGQERGAESRVPERIANWPDDSGVGVFCYDWIDRAQAPKEDARLITDFKEAMSRPGKLKDVAANLDKKFHWEQGNPIGVSKTYPRSLLFGRHLPANLLDLWIVPQS